MEVLIDYCLGYSDNEPKISVGDMVILLDKIYSDPQSYDYYQKTSFINFVLYDKYNFLMIFMEKGFNLLNKKYIEFPNQPAEVYYDILKLVNKKVLFTNNKEHFGGKIIDKEWFLTFLKNVVILSSNIIGNFYSELFKELLSSETYQISNQVKEIILEICKKKPNLSSYQYYGSTGRHTLVHHLIFKFDHELLDNILQYKDDCLIDLNAYNSKGYTPLHLAARYALKNACNVLINHGADVHKKTMKKETVIDLLEESNGTYRFPAWGNSNNMELIKRIKEM